MSKPLLHRTTAGDTGMTTRAAPLTAPDRWRFEANGALTVAALGAALLIAAGFAVGIDGRLDIFSHMRAHMAVALLGLAGLFAVTRAWTRAFLSALVAGVALATIFNTVVLKAAPRAEGPADLTLISFNTQGPLNREGAAIAAYLAQSPADVVFVLEGGSIANYLDDLGKTFPYSVPCNFERCDLLVLSRRPIKAAKRERLLYMPERYVSLRVDTEAGPLTLVGTHLSKPWHGGLQAHHLETVANRITRSDGPVIVVGDFNATPWSRDMARFMVEAGVARVPGFNASWPSEAGPFGFPIDHIMVRGGVSPVDVTPMPTSFTSNHRGFVARFRIDR